MADKSQVGKLKKGKFYFKLSKYCVSGISEFQYIKEQTTMVYKVEKIEQDIHSTKKCFMDLCKEKEEDVVNFKNIFVIDKNRV